MANPLNLLNQYYTPVEQEPNYLEQLLEQARYVPKQRMSVGQPAEFRPITKEPITPPPAQAPVVPAAQVELPIPEESPLERTLKEYKGLSGQEMQQALIDAQKKQAGLNILRGANLIAQAGATAGGAKIGTGEQAIQALERAAQQPVKDILARQKFEAKRVQDEQKRMALDLNKQLNNPNSSISTFARTQALKQIKDPKLAEQLKNMSALQLSQLGFKGQVVQGISEYQKRNLELRERSLDLLEKKIPIQQQREDVRAGKLQAGITKDMEKDRREAQRNVEKDPRWKAALDIEVFEPQAKAAIEAARRGDETALATLGVKVAKALGEKGVLTDKDVTRYTEAASWMQKLKSLGYKAGAAKITPEVRQSLLNMFNEFGNIATRLKDASYDEKARLYMKAQNVPYEEARYIIDPYYEKPAGYSEISGRDTLREETSSYKQVYPELSQQEKQIRNVKIRKFMNANPGVSREKAEQIYDSWLKKRKQ